MTKKLQKRLKALEVKVAQNGIVLLKSQLQTIERQKAMAAALKGGERNRTS